MYRYNIHKSIYNFIFYIKNKEKTHYRLKEVEKKFEKKMEKENLRYGEFYFR